MYFTSPTASDLLDHLRGLSAANAWPGNSLEHIQHWMLTKERRLTNVGTMQEALDLMLATLPSTMPGVHTLHSSPAKRVAQLLPPLMVWAREQPWGDKIDFASLGNAALDYLHHPNAMQPDNLASCVVAAQLLAQTVPHARNAQDAWTLVGPWIIGNPRLWATNMTAWLSMEDHVQNVVDSWIAVGIAAEHADAHRMYNDTSTLLIHRWSQKMKESIAFIQYEQEMIIAGSIAASDASDDLKLLAFTWISAASWMHPHAVTHFDRVLPEEDVQRAIALPWSRLNTSLNQQLNHLYLPLTAQLIDSLAPATVWSDRGLYNTWVKNVAAASTKMPEPLALPDTPDLFSDSNAQ